MSALPTRLPQFLTMVRRCPTIIVTRTLSTVELRTILVILRSTMGKSALTITTCASPTSVLTTSMSVDSALLAPTVKMRISFAPQIMFARRSREKSETLAQMMINAMRVSVIQMATVKDLRKMERSALMLTNANLGTVSSNCAEI